MANNTATRFTTGEVRLSYEHLLKPYANQPGAEAKYSVTLLIPKSDYAAKQRIDAAIQAAAQEGLASKWGGVRPAQLAVPFYDGDGFRPNGEAFGAECKGHWVMTASSKQQPEIVDLNMSRIIDATQIYSGMYARVNINFFPYFNSGKKGIGCGLGPVQKTRDGEPLGSRISAEEAFGGATGAHSPNVPAYQSQPNATPGYPQQPYPAQAVSVQQYQAPAAPAYPQAASAVPVYPPQPPQYSAPAAQPYSPPAPVGTAPWAAPAQQYQAPAQIDPITGQPVQAPIMGL